MIFLITYLFFCLVSYYKNNDKSAQNHIIKHRKLTDDILRQMNIAACDINWYFLDGLTVNGAYEQFIVNIQNILNTHAPLKTIKIPPKYTIRDPWMTPNLLKVSRTCTKLYWKCIGKQRSDTKYKKYIKHRNEYNYLKRSAKQTYYNEIFIKYRNDIRNMWKTINSIIGKQNDKSNTAQRFNLVSEPKQIANNFCDLFYKCCS